MVDVDVPPEPEKPLAGSKLDVTPAGKDVREAVTGRPVSQDMLRAMPPTSLL